MRLKCLELPPPFGEGAFFRLFSTLYCLPFCEEGKYIFGVVFVRGWAGIFKGGVGPPTPQSEQCADSACG